MRWRPSIGMCLALIAMISVGVVLYLIFVPTLSVTTFRQEVESALPLGTPRSQVKEWLDERGYSYRPIIDRENRIVGFRGNIENYRITIYTSLHIHFSFDAQGKLIEFHCRDGGIPL